jgi:hypothetical protein
MDQSVVESAFSITPTVEGMFVWKNNKIVFDPFTNLSYNTTYEVTVTTSATDVAGNPIEDTYYWNFTTGVVDNVEPDIEDEGDPDNNDTEKSDRASFNPTLWIISLLVIIILIVIIVGALMIKRKRRMRQELPATETVTIKPTTTVPALPTEMISPTQSLITASPPDATASTDQSQQLETVSTPLPVLAGPTMVQQPASTVQQVPQVSQVPQVVQPSQLPRLPPSPIETPEPIVNESGPERTEVQEPTIATPQPPTAPAATQPFEQPLQPQAIQPPPTPGAPTPAQPPAQRPADTEGQEQE